MELRSAERVACLVLLLASSACSKRTPLATDAGPIGPGMQEAGQDVGSGGSDTRDAAATDTTAPGDAPADQTGDTTADVPRDMTADVTSGVDAPDDTADTAADVPGGDAGDGGPPDAPGDRGGTDACGSPSDPRNCGTCGHDCTTLQRVRADKVECRNGACFIPTDGCLAGYGNCSGNPEHGCSFDVSQPTQCGCGVTCPNLGTALCAIPDNGPPSCVTTTTCATIPGLTACGQQCIDLQTNVNHCGACNDRCNLRDAISTCVAGQCAVVRCTQGYGDCVPEAPGCETFLGSFHDCRTCGDSCTTAHADGTCYTSGCARTCHRGFGDCDPSKPDCETPLDTAANCGRCGVVCPSNRPLCGGLRGQETCTAACAPPTPDVCGTACTDLQSDPRHCGACGTVCDGYQVCERGRCLPRYVNTDLFASDIGNISIAPNGAYLVGGTFSGPVDFNPGAGQDIRTPTAYSDGFLSRFETDGSYVWTRTWPDVLFIGVNTASGDGSVIATGTFSGTVDFDPGSAVVSLTARGDRDPFVMKLNANGGLAWARALTMTAEEAAEGSGRSLALGGDGSVYLAGSFRGQIDLDPGAATDLHRTAGNDFFAGFVVKLSATGTFVWGRALANPSQALTVALDGTGLLWIGGSFSGTIDLDPGAGVDTLTAGDGDDGFVARWDAGGIFRDSRAYNFSASDVVETISFDADGSAYVAGTSTFTGFPPPPFTGFVQKLNVTGGEVWLQRRTSMYAVTAAPGGGVLFIAGHPLPVANGPSYLVAKLDRDGQLAWGIPRPSDRAVFTYAFAADATKLLLGGSIDTRTLDLDPGAGTDLISGPAGIITRFGF